MLSALILYDTSSQGAMLGTVEDVRLKIT